jgi:hypothetical protein
MIIEVKTILIINIIPLCWSFRINWFRTRKKRKGDGVIILSISLYQCFESASKEIRWSCHFSFTSAKQFAMENPSFTLSWKPERIIRIEKWNLTPVLRHFKTSIVWQGKDLYINLSILILAVFFRNKWFSYSSS